MKFIAGNGNMVSSKKSVKKTERDSPSLIPLSDIPEVFLTSIMVLCKD